MSVSCSAVMPTITASPVPRWTRCSTNATWRSPRPSSCTRLVTRSAPWPTTTTVRATSSPHSAVRTWTTIGRPHTRWIGFGRSERIRVPSPAARTMAETGRPLMGEVVPEVRGRPASSRWPICHDSSTGATPDLVGTCGRTSSVAGSSTGRTPDFGSGGSRFEPWPASHGPPATAWNEIRERAASRPEAPRGRHRLLFEAPASPGYDLLSARNRGGSTAIPPRSMAAGRRRPRRTSGRTTRRRAASRLLQHPVSSMLTSASRTIEGASSGRFSGGAHARNIGTTLDSGRRLARLDHCPAPQLPVGDGGSGWPTAAIDTGRESGGRQARSSVRSWYFAMRA